jgi:hypothetical protein
MVTISSTSFDRRPENIRILPVVISELELSNIQRHIFAAHFVKRADNATLEDRPEAFNGLSVDRADDVLAFGVINDAVRIFLAKTLVAYPLISAKQTDFVGDGFANEGGESGGLDVRDDARNHIPLAADSADDRRFAGTDAACSTAPAALIPMPIFGQAADESFINLDDTAELINVFHQRDADAMAHIPSSFKRSETHITPNLASTYSLFASEHQMNDAVPIAERFIGVFENCSSNMGEAIAVRCALFALPMPFARRKIVNGGVATTRAANAFRPAARDQVRLAGVFVWKHRLELRDGQLVDLRGLFCSGHGSSSECERTLS